jgi:hypothetical protein
MESVRLQRKRIFELQDYIDAQYGGPGKGFFRISPIRSRPGAWSTAARWP